MTTGFSGGTFGNDRAMLKSMRDMQRAQLDSLSAMDNATQIRPGSSAQERMAVLCLKSDIATARRSLEMAKNSLPHWP